MSTKTFKVNGSEVYKVVKPGTSGLSVDTTINCLGVSVTTPFEELKLERQADKNIPLSLAVSGDWTNTQYVSTAVDTTGLTFTATMSDGTSKSVSVSCNPSTWSSTAGTQTCTFTYTEDGTSVSCTKDADIQSAGETWYFTSVPSSSNFPYTSSGKQTAYYDRWYRLDDFYFSSNNSSFTSITLGFVSLGLGWYWDDTAAYYDNGRSGGWTDEAYRTITLAEPATGDLLTWLTANATKQ